MPVGPHVWAMRPHLAPFVSVSVQPQLHVRVWLSEKGGLLGARMPCACRSAVGEWWFGRVSSSQYFPSLGLRRVLTSWCSSNSQNRPPAPVAFDRFAFDRFIFHLRQIAYEAREFPLVLCAVSVCARQKSIERAGQHAKAQGELQVNGKLCRLMAGRGKVRHVAPGALSKPWHRKEAQSTGKAHHRRKEGGVNLPGAGGITHYQARPYRRTSCHDWRRLARWRTLFPHWVHAYSHG